MLAPPAPGGAPHEEVHRDRRKRRPPQSPASAIDVEEGFNPRTHSDRERQAQLVESVRRHGILQPLLVAPADEGEGFRVVAGHRRLAAAATVGLMEVPAIVREPATGEAEALAVIEIVNVQKNVEEPWLRLGDEHFCSRLLVGIEQYDSPTLVREALDASGSDVFITTLDPYNQRSSLLLTDLVDELDLAHFHWIGTTSFARSAESALKTARMLRDLYGINVMKLDVRSDDNRPDNAATITVAETLRAEGMELLPFILPDLDDAATLEQIGCAALRVMAAPVGSGRGIPEPDAIRAVIQHTRLPVIVEGGLGTAGHVTLAMELGAAGVLVNTALVRAAEPILLAEAMKYAVRAGLLAFRSGPMDES